jgi:hypothetical protein
MTNYIFTFFTVIVNALIWAFISNTMYILFKPLYNKTTNTFVSFIHATLSIWLLMMHFILILIGFEKFDVFLDIVYYVSSGYYLYDIINHINAQNGYIRYDIFSIHHIIAIIGLCYLFEPDDGIYTQLGFLFLEISNLPLYVVCIFQSDSSTDNLRELPHWTFYQCLLLIEFVTYFIFRGIMPIIIWMNIKIPMVICITFVLHGASIIWMIGMYKRLKKIL